MAWDRLQFKSITVRVGGISQPASDNLWTQRVRAAGRSKLIARPLNMTLQRMPRVMFTLDLLPKRGARAKLADMLARRLSQQFGAVNVFPRVVFPAAFLNVKLGGVDFAIGVSRRKPRGSGDGEWYVTIDPLDAPASLTNSTSDAQRKYAGDLRLISDEIHALLSTIPGVTRLRWFFHGWDVKKPAVRTTAELPWQVDAAGAGGSTELSGPVSTPPPNEGSPRGARVLALIQRHPSLVGLIGRIIIVSRLSGAMMAAIGILLSLRFLGRLAYGDGLPDVWLGAAIGAVCILVGVCAINLLMPVYRVQRPPTCARDDQRA